ncbi:protein kinase family protein [Microtetraspora malaysiensis]|uniref:Ig-like domain-containing protein n=1 Tax=Microtetraspora malaysiensis TaxID=161358 RepID=A0ABW6SSN4_9ACTN
MDDGGSVAGHRLTGRARSGEIGTWSEAVSPAGTSSGVLRFDPALVATPAARERLVAAVTADRHLARSAGLLPVADLVTARGDIWLITDGAPVPTLADLLAEVYRGGVPSPGSGAVAAILADTARTLLDLHAAGLTHGAPHPGTIVITGDGTALLAERGLLQALRGEPASPERDVTAWIELARGLATSWADDGSAVLFERAAAAAAAHGLAAARDVLLAAGDPLPQSHTTREPLARTRHLWSSAAPEPAPAADEIGAAVTLLGIPGPAAADDVVMRFGPGVPADTAAAQIWRSGTTTELADDVGRDAGTARRPGRRRGRRGAWAGSALLAALLAVVILWLRFQPAADVVVEKVDVRGPKKAIACDGMAALVGTVTTNGGAGTIRYVWVRSDGVRMPEREQNVFSGSTSVELPLRWEVTGSGRFKGVATLRVLSPTASGQPLQDKASFSYRC